MIWSTHRGVVPAVCFGRINARNHRTLLICQRAVATLSSLQMIGDIGARGYAAVIDHRWTQINADMIDRESESVSIRVYLWSPLLLANVALEIDVWYHLGVELI
jgi:hypothetical protein